MGPERNTKKLQRAMAVFGPSPRFDDEPDALNGNSPKRSAAEGRGV